MLCYGVSRNEVLNSDVGKGGGPQRFSNWSDTFGVPMKDLSIEDRTNFDLESLIELRELILPSGGEKRFQDLVTLFLGSLETDIQSMHRALLQRSVSELREIAHELKGTSGTMGANGLVVLCAALDRLCADGQLEGVDKLIREIEEQAQVVRQILAPSTYC
jgi:HPt (histidine-containing phosphotransfer) domain-containing protein